MKGEIEAKLPSDQLKNIKFEFDETILDQQDDSGIVEYTKLKILTYNDDKKISLNTNYKSNGNKNFEDLTKYERTFTGTLTVLDKPTLTVSENYNHDLTGEIKKANEKYTIKYGDKTGTGDLTLQWHPELTKITANGKFTTPFEKLKNIDLQIDHKV